MGFFRNGDSKKKDIDHIHCCEKNFRWLFMFKVSFIHKEYHFLQTSPNPESSKFTCGESKQTIKKYEKAI